MRVLCIAGSLSGLLGGGCSRSCERSVGSESDRSPPGALVSSSAAASTPSLQAASARSAQAASARSSRAALGPSSVKASASAGGKQKPPPPPKRRVDCIAQGQTGLVSLGTIQRVNDVFLQVVGDELYALGYHHALARTTLTRVRRDGQDLQRLAQFGGLGPVASFVVFEGNPYFWRKQSIYRVDQGSGAPVSVAERVARPFVVNERGLFVLRCGDAEHPDELLRVDPRDGEQTLAVMPARAPGHSCGYHYLSVDETMAFVSDWTSRRIYRVTLGTGAVDVLVGSQPYPLRTIAEPGHVVFHSAEGLYRIRRVGGDLYQLSELGQVPYSSVVTDDDDFWIYTAVRFTNVHGLYRVPHAGGSAERIPSIEPFSKKDPLYEAGFVDLAVDDQCIYFARYGHPGTLHTTVSLLAQRKPPRGSAAP